MMLDDSKRALLTQRESAALQALIDKRAVYQAQGHGIAARALSVAIWLVWQTFSRATDGNESGSDTKP
jgi:hypothetical protein